MFRPHQRNEIEKPIHGAQQRLLCRFFALDRHSHRISGTTITTVNNIRPLQLEHTCEAAVIAIRLVAERRAVRKTIVGRFNNNGGPRVVSLGWWARATNTTYSLSLALAQRTFPRQYIGRRRSSVALTSRKIPLANIR